MDAVDATMAGPRSGMCRRWMFVASTLRFFSMLEILEIYIRYLPLKNSLLNRYRKYGIEFNVDRTGNEPLTLQTEPKGEPDHSATASQDV